MKICPAEDWTDDLRHLLAMVDKPPYSRKYQKPSCSDSAERSFIAKFETGLLPSIYSHRVMRCRGHFGSETDANASDPDRQLPVLRLH